MSEEQHKIDVYESRRFEKALNKLPEPQLKIVEDEIERIIATPEIGEFQRGDLSHLRVHKFKMNNQQVLLGYSWFENKLEMYLLHLDTHENFYKKMKSQRQTDINYLEKHWGLYNAIATYIVPERSGRREPRCVKRRPKPAFPVINGSKT